MIHGVKPLHIVLLDQLHRGVGAHLLLLGVPGGQEAAHVVGLQTDVGVSQFGGGVGYFKPPTYQLKTNFIRTMYSYHILFSQNKSVLLIVIFILFDKEKEIFNPTNCP